MKTDCARNPIYGNYFPDTKFSFVLKENTHFINPKSP
jgi:hypothetical protein